MNKEENYYTLGMEVNGRLVFLSGIETDGEKPNVKFTDDEKEINIESDLDVLKEVQIKLWNAGIEVEIISVDFEEEAE